jgi:hypothetical protein
MVSVRDIQGQWREKATQNVWIVSGIVAERAKRPKAQKKPIVLSDGPSGVEWGNGNLKGTFEDGWLVWRNRRNEITYCWKKIENSSDLVATEPAPITAGRKVARKPPITAPPPVPMRAAFKKTEDQSPRSTNSSAESTETAAMAAGMALMNQQSTVPGAEGKPDDIAVAEMKMLVEMAGNRLMAGDVYMSMRYITLAQQVQPVIGGYSETKQ